MAATFLKAKGLSIGDSLLEEEMVEFCGDVIRRCAADGPPLYLPEDVVIAQQLEAGVESKTVPASSIPAGWIVLDIGEETASDYAKKLGGMGTVVWNGPMGVFEVPPFHIGTRLVAEGLAMGSAVSVIGGGSTSEAVAQLGLADEMTHVSTGGGASLEFLEGKELPGVAALDDK
jgi:phosphoglycerate kinase